MVRHTWNHLFCPFSWRRICLPYLYDLSCKKEQLTGASCSGVFRRGLEPRDSEVISLSSTELSIRALAICNRYSKHIEGYFCHEIPSPMGRGMTLRPGPSEEIHHYSLPRQRKRPESGSIRRAIRQSDSHTGAQGLACSSEPSSPGAVASSRPSSQPIMSQSLLKDAPDKCSISGHGSMNSITRHSSLKNRIDSPQVRKTSAAGRSKSFNNHRSVDAEFIVQDIEATMNSALNELRELERQSTAKHAPDVVLDTLEPLKNSAAMATSSEPCSPLHSQLLKDSEPPFQRSASTAGEIPCSFRMSKGGKVPAPIRPPATRPKPSVFPKTSAPNSAVSPSASPTDKSCTV